MGPVGDFLENTLGFEVIKDYSVLHTSSAVPILRPPRPRMAHLLQDFLRDGRWFGSFRFLGILVPLIFLEQNHPS